MSELFGGCRRPSQKHAKLWFELPRDHRFCGGNIDVEDPVWTDSRMVGLLAIRALFCLDSGTGCGVGGVRVEDEDPDGPWVRQGLVICLWPPSPAEELAPCGLLLMHQVSKMSPDLSIKEG